MSNALIVKTLKDEHTCGHVFDKKWLSADWLAGKYTKKFSDDPGYKMHSFNKDVLRKTGVQVSPWQFYRTRKKAMNTIHGTVEEQYTRLWDYCEAIKESNPGTTVKMKLSGVPDKPHFQRLYICFNACKKGWIRGCRHVIGLDGCHLKGPHMGQLLAAIGIDGDNSMFPIAYAVVESECSATWTWFLEFLKDDLEIVNSDDLTWITDKQKGLIEAVKNAFPNSEHRFCVRHLYNNFKLQHKGLHLKQIFWSAARATTRDRFDQEIEKLKTIDPASYKWLHQKEPKHWSKAFFSTRSSCDILLNNLCEVFNAVILEARDKPIITCMDMIRRYISKRIVARRESANKWHHDVGPRVFKLVQQNILESVNSIPDYCGDNKFEVMAYGLDQFRVDLSNKTCDCNRWQLTGLPCPHAICCILSRGLQPTDYVHISYKKVTFVKAYEESIKPMPGPTFWKKTTAIPPLPPAHKKQPGRPKKLRRKEPDEVKTTDTGPSKLRKNYISMTCRVCGMKGHNKRGCPSKTTNKRKEAQQGRSAEQEKAADM